MTVAERLADLPALNVAGLLTTPNAQGPLAVFRDRLDKLLAVPLAEGDGVLIATVPGADRGMEALALRGHFERQGRPVELRPCTPHLLELLLAQWRSAVTRGETGAPLDRTRLEEHWAAVLADAVRLNVSDIHVERSYEKAEVKFRVHGLLQPYADGKRPAGSPPGCWRRCATAGGCRPPWARAGGVPARNWYSSRPASARATWPTACGRPST